MFFLLEHATVGVMVRAGHTEASVDLSVLAGLYPAGVICEIMGTDGHMAKMPELMEFAKEHNLKIVTIGDLIAYRKSKQKLIKRVIETSLDTRYGLFRLWYMEPPSTTNSILP